MNCPSHAQFRSWRWLYRPMDRFSLATVLRVSRFSPQTCDNPEFLINLYPNASSCSPPLRLPKPLSYQFPVRVCTCLLCSIHRLWIVIHVNCSGDGAVQVLLWPDSLRLLRITPWSTRTQIPCSSPWTKTAPTLTPAVLLRMKCPSHAQFRSWRWLYRPMDRLSLATALRAAIHSPHKHSAASPFTQFTLTLTPAVVHCMNCPSHFLFRWWRCLSPPMARLSPSIALRGSKFFL